MDKKFHDQLIVSNAPHLVTKMDTQKTMLMVILALVPAGIVSTCIFGLRVLLLVAVCVAASMAFEALWNIVMKRKQTALDLSSALTGLLIAYNVPVTLPIWTAIVGCFVAIIIVKQLFGGMNMCKYGCLGLGDCTRACNFGAIKICDGVAVVARELCVGCGRCLQKCPIQMNIVKVMKRLGGEA